jgi:hypothetical protein
MAKKLTPQVTSNLRYPGMRDGGANVGWNPAHIGQVGNMLGNHSTEHGTVRGAIEPQHTMARPSQRLGNELATNVGKGGPGTGRRVMASGSQGTHGEVNRGSPPPKRDLFPGWERQR